MRAERKAMGRQKSPVDRPDRSRVRAVLAEGQHAACVDDWLKRSGKGQSPEVLLRLFEAAFSALWARTETTLGEVTLTAIAERVLYNASEKLPFISCVKVEPTGGIECRELRERIGSVNASELITGIRCVLLEFLTVLGNLTAEILTPELHSELSNVALPKAVRVDKRARATQ